MIERCLMARRLCLLLVALVVSACTVGRLDLEVVHAVTEKPARVVVIYRVSSSGQPVVGLAPDAFEVTEDGRTLARENDWEVMIPDLTGRQYVGVLVDYSGEIAQADKATLGRAVARFVERLGPKGKVVVYAYDGAKEPHVVYPSPDHEDVAAALVAFEPNGEPVDLFSAYGTVIGHLTDILGDHALNTGALVLVARGPDRAARLTVAAADARAQQVDARVARYTVAVGKSAGADPSLAQLDNRPMLRVADVGGVERALADVALRQIAAAKSLYVVSLCSYARAGTHEVRISATTDDGKTKSRGSLVHRFSADEFGAGCEPALSDKWGDKAPTRPPRVEEDVVF